MRLLLTCNREVLVCTINIFKNRRFFLPRAVAMESSSSASFALRSTVHVVALNISGIKFKFQQKLGVAGVSIGRNPHLHSLSV